MRTPGVRTVITPPRLAPYDEATRAGVQANTQAGSQAHHPADEGRDTLPAEADGVLTAAPPPGLARQAQQAPLRSPFLPLLLAAMALLGWMGFQTWQLFTDRQALLAAHANQQQTVDNAAKLRGSLDALAADTQGLADAGNASARLLVEELKKRGVTINAGKAVPK